MREDGQVLSESGAILFWLVEGTRGLQTLRWMFYEQYSHEPYVAVARFIRRFLPAGHAREAELPQLLERGEEALAVMERHLAGHAWFSGDAYGIADIALFAHAHCADEAGFDLARYPAIAGWTARVAATPGSVPMRGSSDGS